jgi:hypothetical protein
MWRDEILHRTTDPQMTGLVHSLQASQSENQSQQRVNFSRDNNKNFMVLGACCGEPTRPSSTQPKVIGTVTGIWLYYVENKKIQKTHTVTKCTRKWIHNAVVSPLVRELSIRI